MLSEEPIVEAEIPSDDSVTVVIQPDGDRSEPIVLYHPDEEQGLRETPLHGGQGRGFS